MKKTINKKKNTSVNNKGFTLMEIIAVIIIIGIIIVVSGIAVTSYIEDSRAKTYESYKEDLKVASENYLINCMSGNEEDCDMPQYGIDTRLTYNELVDKGYSDKLKDPEGDGYCDRSYVIAKNTSSNGMDIEYKVCLYCSKYPGAEAAEEGCEKITSDDVTPPSCGSIKGGSTTWTKENKIITVGCKDNSGGIGCAKTEFSSSIGKDGEVIKQGTVTIQDKAGNKKNCAVNAYVDKKAPTCKIEVDKTSINGWYKGEVTARITAISDEGSSENNSNSIEYGMGTSLVNKNYNGSTNYTVSNGIVTVFGYVKDKVGNEGYCSKEIKIDNTNPSGIIYMGYEIYPMHNSIQSGSKLTITDLWRYEDIEGLIIYFNETINKNLTGDIIYEQRNSVKLSGGVVQGKDYAVFKIKKDRYMALQIDLDAEYLKKIKKVEVIKKENTTSVWTNKDVSVYVEAKDTITGIDSYSYDGGSTYNSQNIKTYDSNIDGTIIVKDKVGNISNEYSFKIDKIDKTKPNLDYELTNEDGSNYQSDTWTNQTVYMELIMSDNSSEPQKVQYQLNCSGMWEDESTENKTGNKYNLTFEQEGIYSYCFKALDNAGNESETVNLKIKIDKTAPGAPSVALINSNGDIRNSDTWYNHDILLVGGRVDGQTYTNPSTTDEGGSGINKYQVSRDNINWFDWKYDSSSDIYKISSEGTTHRYVRAIDRAGNISNVTAKIIKIDKTKPHSPTVALVSGNWEERQNDTWYNHNIYVSGTTSSSNPNPSSIDTGGSGIARYEISKDDRNWITWSYDYSSDYYQISEEGITYRYVRAVDNAGNISDVTTKTIKIDKTSVTLTGNVGQWVCGSCMSNCNSYRSKDDAGNCIITNSGSYGNTVGRITYTQVDKNVTFSWEIRQGSATYISGQYYVNLLIKNSSGAVVYSTALRSAGSAAWNGGSVHNGTFTYTFDTPGTYTVYTDGNSTEPSFDMVLATVIVE